MEHPFADLIGLTFEGVQKGTSHCSVAVNEKLFNPQNVVHGGVLYTMADTGMGGALYPLLAKGEYCATIDIVISYFKPVRDDRLECFSKLINQGKTIANLEAEIMNKGILVAKAYGNFSIFRPNKKQKTIIS